ncbi:major facilitator superfamily domain-containing protein [Flammula alnicola]|nr:major facilitator superfamily domain-containing protein [Flammula alnicola]
MTSTEKDNGRQKVLAEDKENSSTSLDPLHQHDPFQTILEEREHPQSLSTARKWIVVFVISSAALCVASASSVAAFAEAGVSRDFHASKEVSILSISMFIEGLGLGPLLLGPLSEIYGRNAVYRVSYTLYFLFTFPVAFAPNIAVYLVFRFVTGFCGSAFLSVAGGSVSDLFDDSTVASPMALYTISPFIGPNLDWRWTYYLIGLVLLVPETYIPSLLKQKAERLRAKTGDPRYWAPLERQEKNIGRAIVISCYRPFQLLMFDHMAFLLDLWTSVILGILYLTFQAYPFIFEEVHGFNTQMTGLSFLGIGVGMLMAISTQPFWNRFYKRVAEENNGKAPPEARLVMGEFGGILAPFGLFWLAFTTYRGVHWIVPILASIPFGAGTYFIFTSTFTYLVTAYRPIAASAMASNSAMRSTFAAAFPLFAGAMYRRLGTVGATALLAGLATILAPLPFIFRRIGAQLRQTSRFAHC